jgi:D-alanyl-D-alanine carboxypeptidase/D-alanyl-D-alanine-endopeptidase (penicillin-binding protein 4)
VSRRALLVAALAGATGIVASGEPATLVWHLQAPDGRVLASHHADLAFNPASVVKIATTLWALERLGPDHRFETRFVARGGKVDGSSTLCGSLTVEGGYDPDFHIENAWLVARALNAGGIRSIEGDLVVDSRFSLGWEGGSGAPRATEAARAREMERRLRKALDPARWDAASRRAVQALERRLGREAAAERPALVLAAGDVLPAADLPETVFSVAHSSNPLHATLKRFNTWSNNDIERLGRVLGPAEDLAAFVGARLPGQADLPRFQTLSGLGTNRMTAEGVVGLLDELRRSTSRRGLDVSDLLPVAGCDPGTLEHYPRLAQHLAGRLVAKTGTLTSTDGGVAVLAGYLRRSDGDRPFCVAAPGSGSDLLGARRAIEDVVLDWAVGSGGPDRPGSCGEPPAFPDSYATVEIVTEP